MGANLPRRLLWRSWGGSCGGEEEDEESEEELEETDSEDEDWEYGDHPLGKGERVKGA